jgi:HEAT repeat protein
MYQKRRIFKLLGLIHDPATIQTISRNLESPDATVRDNAVEVIDDLADSAIRRGLVNLVDRSPIEHKLSVMEKDIDLARCSCAERLQQLLLDEEPFVVACAVHLMGQRNTGTEYEIMAPMLRHHAPLVREAAVQALYRCYGDSALEWIRPLVNDPSAEVRRFVASLIPEAA